MLNNASEGQEEFEDIKGVIRIRKSKDRQYNCHIKNDKQRSTKHYTRKLKFEKVDF